MKYVYSIFILLFLSVLNCFSEEQENIFILEEFNNKTYSEMLKILGSPADKTGYTISNAPTKTWNHQELFSKYPRTKKNADIQIMEVIWDNGEFLIFACFHLIQGINHCLVAKKIRKGINF